MEHKTTSESTIPPALPGEGLVPEVEVWDPPFERWIQLADILLHRDTPPQAKAATPAGSKTIKH